MMNLRSWKILVFQAELRISGIRISQQYGDMIYKYSKTYLQYTKITVYIWIWFLPVPVPRCIVDNSEPFLFKSKTFAIIVKYFKIRLQLCVHENKINKLVW